MPVRNGARYLQAACDSVLSQLPADGEFLIVDDGSTDATPEMLGRLAATDARVRVLRQAGDGLVTALNRGLREARAPLIARMDADDIALPERFARQLAWLAANPGTVALGTGWITIDAAGQTTGTVVPPTSAGAVRTELRIRNCLAHPSVMFRRDAALKIGGYRRALVGAEDYDLWARLSEQSDVENLPEPLLALRLHSHQTTRERLEERILGEIAANFLHRRRLEGSEPAFDADTSVTRTTLIAMGMPEREISAGIVMRAMGAAIDAMRGGDGTTAERAVGLVLAENPRLRTRMHAILLWLRAKLTRERRT